MENKKNTAKKKQEDIALSRALIWFCAAMVVELLLLLLNNIFEKGVFSWPFALDLSNALPIIAVVFALCAAASGVWCWKRSTAKSSLAFLPMVLSVVLLTLAGCAVLIRISLSSLDLLHTLVPAGAVLALVYYLYQREFFFSVCATGTALLGLWLVRKNSGTHDLLVTVYAACGIVLLAAILAFAALLKKSSGTLTIKGQQFTVLPKQTSYLPIFLSCAISVLSLVAGLILDGTIAFYLLFVLLAWLFVLLVYHTVKMM